MSREKAEKVNISFRLTEEESEKLKQCAAACGVLSDVWATPIFSFCFTKPIWWFIANPENMRIPKVQKEPLCMGGHLLF